MQRAAGGVASGLLLFASTPQSIRLAAYCQLPGRGAFNSLSQTFGLPAPLLRRATPVGTRSPYSLPFVILPVPARSPFRFIRHRRRSTPNLEEGAFLYDDNSDQKLSPQAVAPLTPSVSPTARQIPRQGAFLAVSKLLR